MPIIIVCGDEQHISDFTDDFRRLIGKNIIHTCPFAEAISDICQDDPRAYHLITRAYTRSDRYIAFCNARKFATQYLVILLDGNCPDMLDVPSETIRHERPLIISHQYQKEDKNMFFQLIKQKLINPIKKKQNKKINLFTPDKMAIINEILKRVQAKYPRNEEIFLETENIMIKMLVESKREINVELVYEEMLLDRLRERGLVDS